MVRPKTYSVWSTDRGKDTLEDIANTKVGPQDKPLHDITIDSIEIVE